MNHQIVKIYNTHDFERTTKGIKVAQFMRLKHSSSDTKQIFNNFEDLVISNSLCCSYCNTVFADKYQQRTHYKLDWHRFNLKQHLHGLKSVSEDIFKVMMDKNDSSTSDSQKNTQTKDCTPKQWNENKKTKKKTVNQKLLEYKLDSSDEDCTEEDSVMIKNDILLTITTRHSKVFFENEEGNIFSIYRCLLHSKKEIPEVDNEIITQALKSGRTSLWTIVMVGGGHFAAAVFSDGNVIVHKAIHAYTIRAKQGFVQSSHDNRHSLNIIKSAGANIRRQNEYKLTQQIQKVLESWSSYIEKSSLILYRAVGPCNRTKLFGGKNAPLNKNDPRLRPLPFPTRKATFNEVKRVYDILSNMEIYGFKGVVSPSS
ncbi:ankyrin repeat and zinc finger domain-containing protein 1 isoform X2 [Nasonia vitripennis]|uniref:VLRF1 domain-containing protein n=1 Tax=Nasonia vitripennis TaxID=7425 RepID=A0A7M7Q6I6_NASVI|nr:ankyrin repeat and zinc finger domain-containing protein 1 isoform X2 [Nasonia vitripennis]